MSGSTSQIGSMINTLPSRREALLLSLACAATLALPGAWARADERMDDRTPLGEVGQGLEAALAKYREIERAGGWPQVTDAELLKPGARGPGGAALRRRRAATRELAGG